MPDEDKVYQITNKGLAYVFLCKHKFINGDLNDPKNVSIIADLQQMFAKRYLEGMAEIFNGIKSFVSDTDDADPSMLQLLSYSIQKYIDSKWAEFIMDEAVKEKL